MSNVRYNRNQRERAIAERKWLVTVSVDGKHMQDDSCMVQLLTDHRTAKRMARLAVALLKRAGSSSPTESTKGKS